MLTIAILMCFTAVGLACYEAGRADEQQKQEDEAARQYAEAVAAVANRHPSSRPARGQDAVDTYLAGER